MAIIASASDAPTVDAIETSLSAADVDVVRGLPDGLAPSAAVVIVISERATSDPLWRVAVEKASDRRMIPVQVDAVDANRVPDVVRQMNWSPWLVEQQAASSARLLVALRADVRLYREHRELAAETESWIGSGRGEDRLMSDPKRATAAASHVEVAATDALSAPTPEIRAFVLASLKNTRKGRRNRRLRRAGVAVVVLFSTLAATVRVVEIRDTTQKTLIAVSAETGSDRMLGVARPDRIAALAAGVMLESRYGSLPGQEMLLQALARPWAEGALAQDYDQLIRDSAIVEHGRAILTIDSGGWLARWDRAHTALVSRDKLPVTNGQYFLAATPDGRLAAVVSGTRLILVDLPADRIAKVQLPQPATSVAIARRAGVTVVGTSSRVLTIDNSSHAVRTVASVRSVLDLEPTTDGGATALVRDLHRRLRLIDPIARRTRAVAKLPQDRFEAGGVGPDGSSVAITSPDRQLLFAKAGLRFRPTGQVVPDVVDIVRVLDDRRIAFSSAAFGAQLLDVSRAIDLGAICAANPPPQTMRVAEDGDLVACTAIGVTLQRTKPLSPTRARPGKLSSAVSVRMPDVTVVGTPNGVLDVTLRLGRTSNRHFKVADAPITATALRNGGRSVLAGAADGSVAELDLEGRDLAPIVVRWTSPDHAAVTGVGWARSGDRLLIDTATGDRWSAPACNFCAGSIDALDHARRRFWPCYRAQALANFGTNVRKYLGLHTCTRPSAAEER